MKTILESTHDDIKNYAVQWEKIELRKDPEIAKALDEIEKLNEEFTKVLMSGPLVY